MDGLIPVPVPRKRREKRKRKGTHPCYFDANEELDGFAAQSEDDENGRQFSWRTDPEVSFSDWTIVVTDEHNKECTEYHVHRNVLSTGERRCKYFSRIFRGPHREAAEKRSRINLKDLEAKAFPIMLDFLYCAVLDANTEISLPLRHLANYFECRAMMREINRFIEHDLARSLRKGVYYLDQALRYNDDRLYDSALKFTAESFVLADKASLESLSPTLFRSIILSKDLNKSKRSSRALSMVVYEYFILHPDEISVSLLTAATRADTMPRINQEAAKGFLGIIKRMDQDIEPLMCLCRRCFESIDTDWTKVDIERAVRKSASKKAKYSYLAVARLAAALQRAKQEMELLHNNDPAVESVAFRAGGDADSPDENSDSNESSDEEAPYSDHRNHQSEEEDEATDNFPIVL